MNSKMLFSFITGLALGGGGVYLWHHQQSSSVEITAKVTRLETALAEKQTALAKLQAKVKGTDSSDSSANVAEATAAAEQAQAKAMQGMKEQRLKMKQRMEQRLNAKVDEQLAVLKQRLGLTDAQAESVRALLAEKLTKGDLGLRSMGAMMDESTGSPDQVKDNEKEMLDLMLDPLKQEHEMDAKLLALLSDAQKSAYQGHQQEQRTNKVEMATNKELAKLQGAMSLTAEQKDQIFGTLTQFANQEHDQPIPGVLAMIHQQPHELERVKNEMGEESAAKLMAMAEEIKQRQIRRREALKPILSEAQMKVYENLQQASTFDMSEMMGDMGMEMMMMGEPEPQEATEAPVAEIVK
jgi:uncharacterized protein YdcH (DUF465 family)